jgi:cell division protease FtsH
MPTGERDSVGRFILHVALLVLWGLLLLRMLAPLAAVQRLSYSEFKAAVGAGQVSEVEVSPARIRGRLVTGASGEGKPATTGDRFETIRVDDPHLLRDLTKHRVAVTGAVDSTLVRDLLSWVVPALVIVGAWVLLLRPMAGRGGLMAVGRSRAKVYVEKDVKVRFADVAGVDGPRTSSGR